jgi:hypothetical protein
LQDSRFVELRSDGRSRSDVEKREDQGRMSHRKTGVEVVVTRAAWRKVCIAREAKIVFHAG